MKQATEVQQLIQTIENEMEACWVCEENHETPETSLLSEAVSILEEMGIGHILIPTKYSTKRMRWFSLADMSF